MTRRALTALALGGAVLALSSAAASARTITWSGYEWHVRGAGVGVPGPNAWSDDGAHVRVDGADLVLSIAPDALGRWASAEIDSPRHLGYGTYRWVVASDVSVLDPADVLGMFTYGGPEPSHNEIDIEASSWAAPAGPAGSATIWQDAEGNLSRSASFPYTNHPPYRNQFTWAPGSVSYRITDATGALLLDWTDRSGTPTPSTETPAINFWRCCHAPDLTRPHSVRLRSFTFAPPGAPDTAAPPVTLRLTRRAFTTAAASSSSASASTTTKDAAPAGCTTTGPASPSRTPS